MYRPVNPNAKTNLNRLDCRRFRNPLARNPFGMRVSPNRGFLPVEIQFRHFRILRPCQQRAPHSHFERHSVRRMLATSMKRHSLFRWVYRVSCIGTVSLVQLASSTPDHSEAAHWAWSALSLHRFLFYYYCRSYPVCVWFPYLLMAGRISQRHSKQSTRQVNNRMHGAMACVRRTSVFVVDRVFAGMRNLINIYIILFAIWKISKCQALHNTGKA